MIPTTNTQIAQSRTAVARKCIPRRVHGFFSAVVGVDAFGESSRLSYARGRYGFEDRYSRERVQLAANRASAPAGDYGEGGGRRGD